MKSNLKQLLLFVMVFATCAWQSHSFGQSPVQVAGTATVTAATTGNWSAPSTWVGGVIPGDDARVLIPSGVTVTVDGMISQEFKSVRVDNGGKLDSETKWMSIIKYIQQMED